MNVFVLEDFFTPTECEEVRGEVASVSSAAVNISGEVAKHRSLRNSKISFLGDSSRFTRKLRDALHYANARAFHFDLTSNEPAQYAEYAIDGKYDWHLDIGPGSAALRKLSASVQLSSPNDYEGGDLEIWGTPPVDKKQGTLIVFPSYLLHRVHPVTRGLRRSLVVWATGTSPFR